MNSRDIMEILYKTLSKSISNIVLPVGSTLVPSVFMCSIIFFITLICSAFGVYTFLDWKGVLLALVILIIQCYCERRSNNDLLRLYSSAKLQLEKAERRQTRSSADVSTTGDKTDIVSGYDEDRNRTEPDVQDGLRGFVGSASNSSISDWYEESDGQDEADGD